MLHDRTLELKNCKWLLEKKLYNTVIFKMEKATENLPWWLYSLPIFIPQKWCYRDCCHITCQCSIAIYINLFLIFWRAATCPFWSNWKKLTFVLEPRMVFTHALPSVLHIIGFWIWIKLVYSIHIVNFHFPWAAGCCLTCVIHFWPTELQPRTRLLETSWKHTHIFLLSLTKPLHYCISICPPPSPLSKLFWRPQDLYGQASWPKQHCTGVGKGAICTSLAVSNYGVDIAKQADLSQEFCLRL